MSRTEPARRHLVGTASWTDPTLLAAGFYPPGCKTAEARLRHYAERFDTVEVDSSYYALPSERNSALWAERTPEDFVFNVKAFAWLTGHEAEGRSLPKAIQALLGPARLREPRLRAPSPEAREAAFEMFLGALEPLRAAGKLGCLLFQYPPWFRASERNRAYIVACRDRCRGFRLAVELRHASWLVPDPAETFSFLEANDLTYVCVDAPPAPSIPPPLRRATADVAYVRFHGRNRSAWFGRGISAAERFKYLYGDEELSEWAAGIRRLERAQTTYVLFNNCYADYGVRNAATMKRLLEAG